MSSPEWAIPAPTEVTPGVVVPGASSHVDPFFGQKYLLRLYVTGNTANSVKAIANIKSLCEECLAERYEMEVVDIYTNPELAAEDQIIAVPTLVKLGPGPRTRLIGDMSNKARVAAGLGLMPRTQ